MIKLKDLITETKAHRLQIFTPGTGGKDSKNCYDCEHTNFEEFCKECYTELHYYMTEKDNFE